MAERQVSSSQGKSRPTKYRRWAFTINNYDAEEPWRTAETLSEQKTIKYLVVGRELAPTTGTRHLQGYIEYFSCRSFNGVTRHIFSMFNGNAHVEVAHSSIKENVDYCTKEDSDPFIYKGTKKDDAGTVEKATISEMAEMAAKQETEA